MQKVVDIKDAEKGRKDQQSLSFEVNMQWMIL